MGTGCGKGDEARCRRRHKCVESKGQRICLRRAPRGPSSAPRCGRCSARRDTFRKTNFRFTDRPRRTSAALDAAPRAPHFARTRAHIYAQCPRSNTAVGVGGAFPAWTSRKISGNDRSGLPADARVDTLPARLAEICATRPTRIPSYTAARHVICCCRCNDPKMHPRHSAALVNLRLKQIIVLPPRVAIPGRSLTRVEIPSHAGP